MADSHFNDPYNPNANANAGSGDTDKFKNIVQALSIANQYNGQTLLGYVLGRYLKGVYNRWQDGRERKKKTDYYKSQGWVHADGTLYSPQEIEEAKQHAYRKAQQAQNAMDFWNIKPLGETAQQGQYHGGQSVHDYYGQQAAGGMLDGSNTAQPQAAQPAPSSSSAQPTIPVYQANALQQTMGYTPTQPYFSADTGKTAASGTTANAKQWDTADKQVTNDTFSDMVKRFGSLNNAIGGWNGYQQNTLHF